MFKSCIPNPEKFGFRFKSLSNIDLSLASKSKFIPIDKLLIETDSPYLAPEPHRGKKNEPSFVIHTAEKLANLKDVTSIELINKTSLNFENLFN